MEPEHVKWVTQPATLDRWTIEVRPHPEKDGSGYWLIIVVAYCDRRPKPLYTWTEEADDYDPNQVTDLVHHLSLVLYQDRPPKARQLRDGLMGQQALPF